MVCNAQVLLVCLLTCIAFVTNHQSLPIWPCWVQFSCQDGAHGLSPCPCPEKQVVNMQWVSQVGTWQHPREQQGTTQSDTGFGLAPSSKGKSERHLPSCICINTSWKIEVDKSLEKISSTGTWSKDLRKMLFSKVFGVVRVLYPFAFHLSVSVYELYLLFINCMCLCWSECFGFIVRVHY